MLYPIKFYPIFKEKVWGGTKLKSVLNKNIKSEKTGESWEISGVKNNLSIVSNGRLEGIDIQELIETYKSDVVGKKTYSKFGNVFPLLIKFIDAKDDLSVQVHPDNIYAKLKHNENGKNEMWYVVDADKGSDMIVGINNNLTKKEYLQYVKGNNIKDILNFEKIKCGDAFDIPAGRIHAIMKGTLLAEIQQNSDLTYRIFDWNRKGLDGEYRELHTEHAAEVVNLNKKDNYFIKYIKDTGNAEKLISNIYFTVNIIQFDNSLKRGFEKLDSFIIYMCVKGSLKIKYGTSEISLQKGETILIPAIIKQIELKPHEKTELLEIYIK